MVYSEKLLNIMALLHWSFVSTAPPPTGMGRDNDFLKSEAPL